ncbi:MULTISPECIES: molecular chaperone DnaJ [unclassified Methylobacterium]|uniref:molecular chaperone DnaJ n=1 Tax=unclassified Methylobacterium TaxID=2615210 RepID=UPI00226AA546|nr:MULTISPECIES: molecular chaperone DnaJ [unclassified Methylobacterium]
MIIEFDDDLLDRWSNEQLLTLRPALEDLAVRMRRNLRLLDSLLGVGKDWPDLAREHNRLCYDLHEANTLVEALQHDLATARAWIERLQSRLAELQDDGDAHVYASVGLTPNAHAVVVHAARRALLGHYHPDRASPDDKSKMSSQFAAASAAFDRIEALRR